MTATAEPSARVEAPAAPAVSALDRAEGIELLGPMHGSGYETGAALVRRPDGQIVQVGPLMYALLDCLDGERDVAELSCCLSDKLGRECDEEHVVAIAEKLAAQGLLAGTEANAPPRPNPLLGLRFKVLITDDRITDRLTRPFTFLFRPWVIVPVLLAFLAVCWFVLVEKGVAAATSEAFAKPELLLLVFALAVGSAGFHEIGHAAAARVGGARPGGMGMGLYLVWPAFYTDVTDAYRLPRGDRLRVDLGGLYFNTIIAVATLGAWFAWRKDALLLLVALQLIQMVQQLSPVIRADGYHILSDLTGVPDLYAHIGPTLKRLLPWRRNEPSALHGRARVLVTAWVLVIVPLLLALVVGAILLLPRLAATAWASGREIGAALPEQVSDIDVLGVLTSSLRLVALVLPVLGVAFIAQQFLRTAGTRAWAWSDGDPVRQLVLGTGATALAFLAAWAWWPSGQYEPIRASERGTLVSFSRAVASPKTLVRPGPAPVQLKPGTYLALAAIPEGGATAEQPALLVIPAQDGEDAVAIVSGGGEEPAAVTAPVDASATTEATATTTTEAPPAEEAPAPAPAAAPSPTPATAFPFELPKPPGEGGTQAMAVNTTDGSIKYTVAYALVTVSEGKPVTNTNSAFAIASCRACTTVAVSFQVVLVVGSSNVIAPINAAGALNYRCPACTTMAIADQIVVTLRAQPTDDLVADLTAALKELDALPALGTNTTAVVREVVEVQKKIEQELEESGLLANPRTTTTTSTTGTTTGTTTTSATTTATTTTTSTTPTATGATATQPVETAPPPPTTTTSPSSTTTTTSTEPATTPTTETPTIETTTTEPTAPTTTN